MEQTFDFPEWLGNFDNERDWCEPRSTRADFNHLIEYAARYAPRLRRQTGGTTTVAYAVRPSTRTALGSPNVCPEVSRLRYDRAGAGGDLGRGKQ